MPDTTTAIVTYRLDDLATISLIGSPRSFAEDLMELKGNQFLQFQAEYSMDAKGKMTTGKKIGKPNPYLGKGLKKISKTSATVNFNYNTKVARRGGEEAQTKGTWHTAVLVNGKVSPVSVHKGDVITELPEGLKDNLNNRRAVLDDEGNVQFITNEPRLYLRYEITRKGTGERQQQAMQTKSHFEDAEGNVIEKEDLQTWLPARQPRTDETDMQVTSLDNVTELHAGGKVYRRMSLK